MLSSLLVKSLVGVHACMYARVAVFAHIPGKQRNSDLSVGCLTTEIQTFQVQERCFSQHIKGKRISKSPQFIIHVLFPLKLLFFKQTFYHFFDHLHSC